jgi:hypothetical protein
MSCVKCEKLKSYYLDLNPEWNGVVLCESCFEMSKEYIVYINLHNDVGNSLTSDSCNYVK